MNNIEISYPTRENISLWMEMLREENSELKLKLPLDDEDWYIHVLATIERINNEYTDNLYEKAAKLFYYLDKGHNFLDGNKRTSIVITYLFLLLNRRWITSPNRMEVLAKEVAKSKGSRNIDYWMKKIETELRYITLELPES